LIAALQAQAGRSGPSAQQRRTSGWCQPAVATGGWAQGAPGVAAAYGLSSAAAPRQRPDAAHPLAPQQLEWSWSWRRAGPLGPLLNAAVTTGKEGCGLGRSHDCIALARNERTNARCGILMPLRGRGAAELIRALRGGGCSITDRLRSKKSEPGGYGQPRLLHRQHGAAQQAMRDALPLFRSC